MIIPKEGRLHDLSEELDINNKLTNKEPVHSFYGCFISNRFACYMYVFYDSLCILSRNATMFFYIDTQWFVC
jgi:hypothetical protein